MNPQQSDRVVQQRTEARDIAQSIRLNRAKLKHEVKHGNLVALRTLLDPPDWLERMAIIDFVMAVPRVGHDRAIRYLDDVGCSELREIGKLTARQRGVLYEALAKHWVFSS